MWFWTFNMSEYLMEPIKDNEDFKGAVRNVNTNQKWPKRQKDGFERRLQFCDYFKNVIVDTQIIFNFSYIRLPYETSQRH